MSPSNLIQLDTWMQSNALKNKNSTDEVKMVFPVPKDSDMQIRTFEPQQAYSQNLT